MVKCKYCGKEFNSNVGLGVHKKSCDGWIKELNLQIKIYKHQINFLFFDFK